MKQYQTWYAEITPSILGPVVPWVRRAGAARLLARDAPAHVRQYLNLPEDRRKRPVVEGLNWPEAQALTVDQPIAGQPCLLAVRRGRHSVRLRFRLLNPTYRPPRPKLTVREHGPLIRNFRGLLDYFGAETPGGLNRRVYKATDCGASISVYLRDGRTLHNGDRAWEGLTGAEKIDRFTIQTIVEGSEATVDSQPFLVPCTQREVAAWIADMEAEADRLWHEANDDEGEGV